MVPFQEAKGEERSTNEDSAIFDKVESDGLRILYLFSGTRRAGDLGHWLRREAKLNQVKLKLKEVDILRGRKGHNLLSKATRPTRPPSSRAKRSDPHLAHGRSGRHRPAPALRRKQ